MTQEISQETKRFYAAAAITQHPERFKICEGCGSILAETAAICPLCSAYRFNDNPMDVVKKAWDIASKEPTTILE